MQKNRDAVYPFLGGSVNKTPAEGLDFIYGAASQI
jgi:hypothetical protein